MQALRLFLDSGFAGFTPAPRNDEPTIRISYDRGSRKFPQLKLIVMNATGVARPALTGCNEQEVQP